MILTKKIQGHYVYLDDKRDIVICKNCGCSLDTIAHWIIPRNINTPCFYFNICWDCFMKNIHGKIQHYNFIKKYQKNLIDNKLFAKLKK